MFRSGLVNTLVTHANKEGFGLTPLSRDHPGYKPPLLKNKKQSDIDAQFTVCTYNTQGGVFIGL